MDEQTIRAWADELAAAGTTVQLLADRLDKATGNIARLAYDDEPPVITDARRVEAVVRDMRNALDNVLDVLDS